VAGNRFASRAADAAGTSTGPDASARELLGDWRSAPSEETARHALERLFTEYAQPWCREITRGALRNYAVRTSDREDQAAETESEVLLKVTARLQSVRSGEAEPIADLRAYIASCVYNSCFLRLRAGAPARTRLENRLRYLLRHDSRFAAWEAGDFSLAGFARWKNQTGAKEPVVPAWPAREPDRLLTQIFEEAGGPVPMGSLIAVAAEALGVSDPRPPAYQTMREPAGQTPGVEAAIDRVERLRQVWREVLTLPPNQRAALLLNLRDADGQGVIELIPATGVATFDELAAALGISAARLEEIWNDLPLEDSRIAETLGISRQQVINLRKSARWRLARRTAKNQENMAAVPASILKASGLNASGPKVEKRGVLKRLFGVRSRQ